MNIIPNIWIVLIAMAVFFLNMVIVKKFWLEPYLKLREKRHSLTEGLLSKAAAMREESKKSLDSIEEKLRTVALENKQNALLNRQKAKENAEKIIREARVKSTSEIARAREEIKKQIQNEKNLMAGKLEPLADSVFKNVLKI